MHITFLSLTPKHLKLLHNTIGEKLHDYTFSYVSKRISTLEDISDYDVIVSPANSFGALTGGIDAAYYKILGGKPLQQYIYKTIKEFHQGEILLGSTCTINLKHMNKYFVLCPTMTTPMGAEGTRNAYYFMRALLNALAKIPNVKNVLCPLPCVGVGQMNPKSMVKQIKAAIDGRYKRGDVYDVYENINDVEIGSKMMFISHTKN